jgi:hypothetical protein
MSSEARFNPDAVGGHGRIKHGLDDVVIRMEAL